LRPWRPLAFELQRRDTQLGAGFCRGLQQARPEGLRLASSIRKQGATSTPRRARPRWRLRPVPGVPARCPARAGGRAVRTARSWRGIVAFTHPRTGGANDSHHWTARIAGRPRAALRRRGRPARNTGNGWVRSTLRSPIIRSSARHHGQTLLGSPVPTRCDGHDPTERQNDRRAS
jgi:hypothetical protein